MKVYAVILEVVDGYMNDDGMYEDELNDKMIAGIYEDEANTDNVSDMIDKLSRDISASLGVSQCNSYVVECELNSFEKNFQVTIENTIGILKDRESKLKSLLE